MPNPIPGDGAIVGTVGQVLPVGVLYIAAYNAVTPVAPPGVALGATEPGGSYVKLGLLRDDQFTVAETDPTLVEYRRGFRQRYFGEVIRKVGDRSITAQIDEVEPLSFSLLMAAQSGGSGYTSTGSPITSAEIDLGAGEIYDYTMLGVFYDDQSHLEFHMYSPHVRLRYKFGKQAEFMVIDLTIRMIPFINASNLYKDLKYYMF